MKVIIKNCVKGYNCGNSCITRKKICRVALSKKAAEQASSFLSNIQEATREQAREATREEQKAEHAKANRVAIDKDIKSALKAYTDHLSSQVRVAESKGEQTEIIKDINKYLDDPRVPAFGLPIYHGFREDMAAVYGLDRLQAGSEFSLPSMTSFSSDLPLAESFNGGGRFVIKNNKSGKSIMAHSRYGVKELEVLVPKKAKYRVASITKDRDVDVYTIEEI